MRFANGDQGTIGPVEWRVRRGGKAPGDLVVELRSPGWCRVKMAVVCLLADFHYQVEEILYPRAEGKAGGEYILGALTEACRDSGWAAVAARIERERNGGRYPSAVRYAPLPPWSGRDDDGAIVAAIRARVTHAMWVTGRGMAPEAFVQEVRNALTLDVLGERV